MQPHKSTILDGTVHIYSRPNSPFFWCGFHHKGRYIRTSTKQTLLSEAEQFARQWHRRKDAEITVGSLRVGGISFNKAAEHAQRVYEQMVARGEKSGQYLLSIKKVLKARVLPYFKKVPIDQIGTREWNDFKDHIYSKHPTTSRSTMHQYKNAIRVVLREAVHKGWIKQPVVFARESNSRTMGQPRSHFDEREYKELYTATRANIKKLKKTRWARAAEELHDYVLFVANTGLRIGEARNVRFCDVEIVKEHDAKDRMREVLVIRNIKGKRGTGACRSFYGAVPAYRRFVARRKPKPNARTSQQPLFVEHHREMFNTVLANAGLKFSNSNPPRRRDLMSLRHTYICFRLGQGVPIYDVANNCRTSVQMIEQHYARWLPASSNINRIARSGFGSEG